MFRLLFVAVIPPLAGRGVVDLGEIAPTKPEATAAAEFEKV
jgi:hypothetical protein